MKRPVIFFSILLIGILMLAAIRMFVPMSPGAPQPGKPSLEVPPAPTIGIIQPTGVTFAFVKEPSLPATVPIYAYTDFTRAELESSIASVVSEYAIPATSTSLLRAGVFTREWSRDGAMISLQEEGGTSTVTFRQAAARGVPATPQNNQGVAQNFIAKLVPPSAPVALTPAGVTNDIAEGILITDSLGVRSLGGYLYSYTIDALPIVPYPFTSQTSFAIVDNLGIVRSATIHPAPKTVTAAGQVPVLTASDILVNLSARRGALISAVTQEDPATAGTIAFAAFRIDAVSVVYARNQGLLLPAFIIHGEGTTARGTGQEATFFLWASPISQPTPVN